MLLQDCNPFIRNALIHDAIPERSGLRKAYDYRIFYILENSGSILINDSHFSVSPDTLIIIPPDTPYDFQGSLKVCVLNFDVTRRFAHRSKPLYPPCIADFDRSLLFETELLEDFDSPCVLTGEASVREKVLQIVRTFHTRSKYADAIVSAMLKLLFSELLSRRITQDEKRSEKIMSYIRIHAASIQGNEDVARKFGYHPVYLTGLIKRTTGKTLHSAIVDAKLQLACQWLAGTDESIDNVAHFTGFCSRTHFCTLFKKKIGVSPTEYRKTPNISTP